MTRIVYPCLVALIALLAACKGCGDPCRNVECPDGESCVEGTCVADEDSCVPACEDGEVCQGGLCVTLQAQCTTSGQDCDASRPPGDGFLCIDFDGFGPRPGTCMAPCAADGSCPSGALCFYVSSASDTACTTTDDCPAGRECADGTCLQTICRPSECDGFLDGNQTCATLYANFAEYANGAHCYDVGNDARYCYPAGVQDEGEACGDTIEAIITNNFAPTCGRGLACVDSVCRTACADDAACGGEQACILEDVDLVDEGVGICGDPCTPFEVGSCGAGRTCIPVSADEGVCTGAGDRAAFEPCTPGASECVDGTVCITYQDNPEVARCQPICNLTVAPPNDDGSVGDFAQTQRDATCPQPDVPPTGWLGVANLAELGTAIDLYVGAEAMPTLAGLPLDGQADSDPVAPGAQWTAVPPGTQVVRVLPAGAPSTDPPLASQSLTIAADQVLQVYLLPVPAANDEVELWLTSANRAEAGPAPGNAQVRVVQALVDALGVDAILVPPGDDLSDPGNQVVLAEGLGARSTAEAVEAAAGNWDLLVFAAGDPRTDRLTALVAGALSLADGQRSTVALRGTIDPDDLPNAGFALLSAVEPPPAGQGGAAYTCVDVGAGAFGFCQQNCGGGAAGFGATCEGAQMGCHPTFLDANGRWANLCAPLGPKALGESCDPFAEYSECGEGAYCLEFGNTVPQYSALQRGRCTSLCEEGEDAASPLQCDPGQACETISFDVDYTVGRCGYPCAPGTGYGDSACPVGLQSCKPRAALVPDPANPDAYPDVVDAPAFCSASGDIATQQTCTANDCVPGTECMFPRSEQNGFTASLLSQYFGAVGLTPACTPQCDPFDGDSSSTSCAAGETCLFNFPLSAEVGHCAPIEVELDPLQPCANPGLACGRDSICVVNAGAPTCFQFCQYRGPTPSGELQPETCAAGFLCAPLANDVGICLSP